MFEFLFALFGSIGIGARASHEKAVLKEKSQETKQWIDTMKDDLQKWESKVFVRRSFPKAPPNPGYMFRLVCQF